MLLTLIGADAAGVKVEVRLKGVAEAGYVCFAFVLFALSSSSLLLTVTAAFSSHLNHFLLLPHRNYLDALFEAVAAIDTEHLEKAADDDSSGGSDVEKPAARKPRRDRPKVRRSSKRSKSS